MFPTFSQRFLPVSPAPRRSARDRPGFASRLMLQCAMGLSALPLKTVRAVGATKDLGLRKNRRMPEIFVEKKPGFLAKTDDFWRFSWKNPKVSGDYLRKTLDFWRFRRGETDDFWQKLRISCSSSANPRSTQGIFDSSSEISTMTSWKTRYTQCGALRLCL